MSARPADLLAAAVRSLVDEDDVEFFRTFRPIGPQGLPSTAEGPGAAAEAAFGLALFLNEVPESVGGGLWASQDHRVWDAYAEALQRADLAGARQSAADPDVARARAALFEDDLLQVPTPALAAYREHQGEWEEAALAAESAGAGAPDAETAASRATAAREAVGEAARRWEATGHKAEVEGALAVLARASAASAAAAWAEAQTRLNIAARSSLAGGRYLSTQLLPFGFDPAADASWSVLVADAADGAGPLPPGALVGLNLPDGDVVEAELAVLDVERSWLDWGLLGRRDWRWRDPADGPLSDGGDPARGRLPGVATSAVLVRRVVGSRRHVEPSPDAFEAASRSVLQAPAGDEAARRRAFLDRLPEWYTARPPGRTVAVADEAGAPVEGAHVRLGLSVRDRGGRQSWRSLVVLTGADGRATVPDLWLNAGEGASQVGSVWVQAEGHAAARAELDGAPGAVDVRLRRLASLKVLVTTTLPLSGRRVPLAGARVQLVAPDGGAEFSAGRVLTRRTGADGVVECRLPYASVASTETVVCVDALGYRKAASAALQQRDPLGPGDHAGVHVEMVAERDALPEPGGTCRMIAAGVRRLPLAPDPDPSLPWD